ncbi:MULTISPECIES: hypothetical protein [unclassified Mycobacterium]|nr:MULTISPECIES: hypothetical protein [unclassified Mycobacterium]
MTSPEFADDMTGFDVGDIVDVQTTPLDPTPFSPIDKRPKERAT